MVSQSHVPSFEGRWLMTTSDQLEVSEQAYCGTASPDGVNQDHEGTGPGDHCMAKLNLIIAAHTFAKLVYP